MPALQMGHNHDLQQHRKQRLVATQAAMNRVSCIQHAPRPLIRQLLTVHQLQMYPACPYIQWQQR
jgi:hypothetical protein